MKSPFLARIQETAGRSMNSKKTRKDLLENTKKSPYEEFLSRFSSTQDSPHSTVSEQVQQKMENVSHDFEILMRIHKELKDSFEKLKKPSV
jgi:hypothetical protein